MLRKALLRKSHGMGLVLYLYLDVGVPVGENLLSLFLHVEQYRRFNGNILASPPFFLLGIFSWHAGFFSLQQPIAVFVDDVLYGTLRYDRAALY